MVGSPAEEAFLDALEDRLVTDDAAGGHFGWAGLELGLEEGDDRGARWDAGCDGRQDFFEGDEREVGDDEVDGRQVRQVAGVDAFEEGDAEVLAKAVVELGLSDVDGDDVDGSVLEEAVGEPARRCSDVEAGEAGGVDGEGGEGGFELEASATDVAEWLDYFEWGVGVEGLGGFDEDAGAGPDLSGHDELAGAFAGFG